MWKPTRTILTLVVLAASTVAGCGDDGVHALPDAPPPPDAAPDSGIDAVPLLVTLAGSGTGTITSTPAGILCGAACESMFPKNLPVTLTAVPGSGSVFAGWSGACAGSDPTCEVTLENAKAATATFNLAMYTVEVTRSGAGAGQISGGGITCGANCSVTVPHGTAITLTSAAGALSTFAGWGGACSGDATTCTLTITADTTVSANFALDDVTLFVTKGGNGDGAVTSSPAGISCGVDCDQTYTANQVVTLNARPVTGSVFEGWSGGGCTGTGPCTLTMTAATTVTAKFTLQQFTLSVTKSGSGAGTVNATGIACGADCMETVTYGTTLTLSAVPSVAPSTASTFGAWSGACTGTGSCTVTVTADMTVNASFALQPNVMFVTSTFSDGNLGGLDGADRTCNNLAVAAGLRGTFVAYLSSTAGPIHAPSRVGTAAGWVRVDGRPVMQRIEQMHLGTLINPPRLTERGEDVDVSEVRFAWTGTSAQGTVTRVCSTAAANVPWGGNASGTTIGQPSLTTSGVVEVGTVNCTGLRRLYCLGIDRRAALP